MKEEQLREAVGKLDLARAQLEGLVRQSEIIRMSLEEHMRAKETISRYRDTQSGDSLLVPVGANCFVFANVESKEEVICGLGSDVAMKDSVEGAISRLDKRIKMIVESEEELGKKITELDSEVAKLSEDVQKKYEEYQAQA